MSEVVRGAILLISATKGGNGKSTLVLSIASELVRRGYSVCIIDADKQRTVSKWLDRRNQLIEEGKDIPYIHGNHKLSPIKSTVNAEALRHDFVLIDTGGHDSRELREALILADVFYAITPPKQASLDTIDDFIGLLEETRMVNAERNDAAFLNDASTHHMEKDTREAREFLADIQDVLPHRVYETCHREGYGPVEIKTRTSGLSQAKAEIQLLAQEILKHV